MYPHPELNSFLQASNLLIPRKILNRAVDRALGDDIPVCRYKCPLTRLCSEQPQFYGPHVDVTRAKCAFGNLALPKLIKELHCQDPLTVRQAVTTLGDLLINPEKLSEALNLNVVEELTDLLVAEDPYLRERVAIIFRIIASHNLGRKEMINNCNLLLNLSKGINDYFAAVRLKVAHVLEFLAQESRSADLLIACGFVEAITVWLDHDTKEILLVHLDILKWFFQRNISSASIKEDAFEKLVALLDRKDELVLEKTLKSLGILCEDPLIKEKANETCLLTRLRSFLRHKSEAVKVEAVRVASFVTITTKGKLQALKLNLINPLLYLATRQECCHYNFEMILAVFKILTNIAEAPEGRKILLNEFVENIENINVRQSDVLQNHKQSLLDVINWKP